jgi:hypothetical protein
VVSTRTARCLAAVLLLALVPALSCGRSRAALPEGTSQGGRAALDELAARLEGTYSNAEQARSDPERHESERLVVTRLWQRRVDGPWLLVERAAVRRLDRPRAIWVWRLAPVQDGLWRIDTFDLPGDPLDFAGAGSDASLLEGLRPADLAARRGCELLLSRSSDDGFHGTTTGTGCARGVDGRYTTVQLTVLTSRISLWQRQHDAVGRPLPGTPNEPSLFDLQSRFPPPR